MGFAGIIAVVLSCKSSTAVWSDSLMATKEVSNFRVYFPNATYILDILVLAALSVSFGSMIVGFVSGFTSPALDSMSSSTVNPFPLTTQQLCMTPTHVSPLKSSRLSTEDPKMFLCRSIKWLVRYRVLFEEWTSGQLCGSSARFSGEQQQEGEPVEKIVTQRVQLFQHIHQNIPPEAALPTIT
ncbi:hypothetical protein PR048_013500 [Dryococelus australis]|uniref:Uncharacterized protein n=1 Tax=Dryococelus australis TaxID=614101 RepID=A0ABQ9HSN0_9NEOP|nr:hypothetical protein PR048_013500 [Dryococelus australis]